MDKDDISNTITAAVKETVAQCRDLERKGSDRNASSPCPIWNRRNPLFLTRSHRKAASGPTITPSLNSSSGTARSLGWLSTELSFCVTGSVWNKDNTHPQRLICASRRSAESHTKRSPDCGERQHRTRTYRNGL